MNTLKQKGSAEIIIAIIVFLAILVGVGFAAWNSFASKSADTSTTENTKTATGKQNKKDEPTYTFENAVNDINSLLAQEGCDGSGVKTAVDSKVFKQVADTDPYEYQGGVSRINSRLTHALVQYGCGSQGSVALMKKDASNTWTLISEDARSYPMCAAVRGHEFPSGIIDKCYETDDSSEPVDI